MFKPAYELFGLELVCSVIETSSNFKSEKDSYSYIKKLATSNGWKYARIDTVDQIGFPDILILREDDYYLFEAKKLKQKTLVSLEDSLEWQFGQLAFAVRAFTLKLSYAITVCYENKLAIIGREQLLCKMQQHLNY